MKKENNKKQNIGYDLYWDSNISEYEIDPSWKNHEIYKNKKYIEYRKKWELVSKGELTTEFPLNIELDATYYCNLKCPYCPRMVNKGEKKDEHMKHDIWNAIIKESKENNLPSMQMDHEGESMMNPNFFDMLNDVTSSGIFDTWLHTNGMMLNEKNSIKLIKNGLKKLNISIDAFKEETYKKLRIGGKFEQVKNNVFNFLKLKEQFNASYLRVRVSFVEQEENFDEKRDFFNFWSTKKGLNTITFQRCMNLLSFDKKNPDSILSEEEIEKKYKDHKPFYCHAPWETPTIEESGKITPCLKPVREHSKDFYIGDLSKGDTIKKAWNSEKMKKLREVHSKGEWYKVDMCRTCVKVTRESQHKEFKIEKKQ